MILRNWTASAVVNREQLRFPVLPRGELKRSRAEPRQQHKRFAFRSLTKSTVEIGLTKKEQEDERANASGRNLHSQTTRPEVTGIIQLPVASLPEILVPPVGVVADEVGHHLDTFRVVEHDQLHTALTKEIFRAEEV